MHVFMEVIALAAPEYLSPHPLEVEPPPNPMKVEHLHPSSPPPTHLHWNSPLPPTTQVPPS